jgi:hypothetical protein
MKLICWLADRWPLVVLGLFVAIGTVLQLTGTLQ